VNVFIITQCSTSRENLTFAVLGFFLLTSRSVRVSHQIIVGMTQYDQTISDNDNNDSNNCQQFFTNLLGGARVCNGHAYDYNFFMDMLIKRELTRRI